MKCIWGNEAVIPPLTFATRSGHFLHGKIALSIYNKRLGEHQNQSGHSGKQKNLLLLLPI
jgi:hypothetical protein